MRIFSQLIFTIFLTIVRTLGNAVLLDTSCSGTSECLKMCLSIYKYQCFLLKISFTRTQYQSPSQRIPTKPWPWTKPRKRQRRNRLFGSKPLTVACPSTFTEQSRRDTFRSWSWNRPCCFAWLRSTIEGYCAREGGGWGESRTVATSLNWSRRRPRSHWRKIAGASEVARWLRRR